MKKALIILAMVALTGTVARAQLTPEGVMAALPDMPTAAQMIDFADGKGDSDLYGAFLSKLNDAQKQCQEMVDKSTASLAYDVKSQAMKEKVPGTNISVAQAQNMSKDELRALAMAAARGRIASVGNTKAPAGNAALTPVVQKITSLQKRITELTQKSIKIREDGNAFGKELYAKEYKNIIEPLQEEVSALSATIGGGEETAAEAARGLEIGAKITALNKQIDGFRHDFYSKSIPVWRNAVTSSMDVFRSEVLPLQYELKEAYAKAYELTGSHEYMGGDQLPFSAAFSYLDAAAYINQFDF